MNKLKLSDSDKRLLVIFLAIIIVVCSYFFVFTKNMDKASEIEEQNDKDRATVQQMEAMEANLPQVRENIKELKQKEANIIARYPADLKTEKVIEILQSIEDNNNSDFHIKSISFLMGSPMIAPTADGTAEGSTDTAAADTSSTEAASTETAASDGTEAAAAPSNPVSGYYATIGINYEASYTGLKDMIEYVNTYEDRMTISDTSASFDSETGGLSGTMTLNMYYLMNTGKEYIPPEFEGISKGVTNIFGGSADDAGDTDE